MSGFSLITSKPRSRNALATGKCRRGGVAMTTASTRSGRAASFFEHLAASRCRCDLAPAAPDARSASAIFGSTDIAPATRSQSPSARMAMRCVRPITESAPPPTMPIRTRRPNASSNDRSIPVSWLAVPLVSGPKTARCRLPRRTVSPRPSRGRHGGLRRPALSVPCGLRDSGAGCRL